MKNRNFESYIMYFGFLYYIYITKPIKNLYLSWKYRKERKEVRDKYVKH